MSPTDPCTFTRCHPAALAPIAHDLDFDLKLPTAKPSVAKVDLPVSEVRADAPPALDFVIDSPAPSAERAGAQPASGLDFDLSGLDVPAKSTASSSSLADAKGGLDGQYNDDALDLANSARKLQPQGTRFGSTGLVLRRRASHLQAALARQWTFPA
jgi:hypothetical protein